MKGPTRTASVDLSASELAALHRVLSTRVDGVGPLRAELLSGGRSNLTYTVTDGERHWVLRRPPLGHVLATAHDMQREYRVMHALAGTAVPVPRTILIEPGSDMLGAPFYVMERVDGVVHRTAEDLAGPAPAVAREIAHRFVDALADLHEIDPAAVALADFGRADGYLARQMSRWRRQLSSSQARDITGFDELATRLASRIPSAQRASIVHGDYRLDNAIISLDGRPTVAAVLDWEMATLGDPLADLGLFRLYWEGWGGLDNPIAGTPAEHGFPAASELAERYALRTGLDLSDSDWYEGFAFYKFAVICEGIHFRHVQGLTVGDGFDRIGAMVPELVRRGLTAVHA